MLYILQSSMLPITGTRLIGKIAYMELKERISLARKRAHLTQKQLADRVGISRQAILQWEKGHTKSIDGANAIRAAHAMNVDPLWLTTGEGNRPIALGINEEKGDYEVNIPLEIISAWPRLDKAMRQHVMAIVLALANKPHKPKM